MTRRCFALPAVRGCWPVIGGGAASAAGPDEGGGGAPAELPPAGTTGGLVVGELDTVTTPIAPVPASVNQRVWPGPGVFHQGWEPGLGVEYSVMRRLTGSIFAIRPAPDSVNQTWPSG